MKYFSALSVVVCLRFVVGCCTAGAAGTGGDVDATPEELAEADAEGDVATEGAGGEAKAGAGATAGGEAKTGWEAELAAAAKLDENATPIEQLKSIPDKLQKQIDVVLQPITDAEAVINDIATMPDRLGVSAAELRAAAKASLDSGSVSANVNVSGAAKAEIDALLVRIKAIGTGLREMPKRSAVAVKNVLALGAQAVKLQTGIVAKGKFAFGKKGEQAKADAASATQVGAQIKGQISQVKATIMGLPAKATGILAKLAASFAT